MERDRLSSMPLSNAEIAELVDALASDDGIGREEARMALIHCGRAAAPALIEALSHPDSQVRLEAARALKYLHAPESIEALVELLNDEHADVRWAASEALIPFGRAMLPALYGALIDSRHRDITWLRRSAHHILKVYLAKEEDEHARRVLEALESLAPGAVAPAAFEALEAMHGRKD